MFQVRTHLFTWQLVMRTKVSCAQPSEAPPSSWDFRLRSPPTKAKELVFKNKSVSKQLQTGYSFKLTVGHHLLNIHLWGKEKIHCSLQHCATCCILSLSSCVAYTLFFSLLTYLSIACFYWFLHPKSVLLGRFSCVDYHVIVTMSCVNSM